MAIVEPCLLGRDEIKMANCVHGSNGDLLALSMMSDPLGWGSFLVGRITSQDQKRYWQTKMFLEIHYFVLINTILVQYGKFLCT